MPLVFREKSMTYFDPSQIFGNFTDKENKEAERDVPQEKRQIQLHETETISNLDTRLYPMHYKMLKQKGKKFSFLGILFFSLSTFIQHSKLSHSGQWTPSSKGTLE